MTDVTTYPLIDDFDTTLAQAWDGATGTIYLNEAVGVTIPSGVTTLVVVSPGKSIMQVAEINAVDNSLKTATVSSIAVDKGAGVAYTQQTHPVGSVVRISTNYAFWKDLVDGINSKIDTNSDDIDMGKFADATARDAYFTSPVNGNSAYLTAEGKRTDYIAGAWEDRDTGTVTANASETVAGKVEIATQAEITAGTATGDTGASLVATPADLATTIQSGSWVYCASTTGSDTYTATMTPTLTAYTTGMLLPCKFTTTNTGACSINIDGLGAKNIKTLDGNDPQNGVIRATGTALLMYDGTNFVIQSEDFATATVKGIVEMATDAEANTGTDETRYVNSKQAKNTSTSGIIDWNTNQGTGTTVVAHGLGKTPVAISFFTYQTQQLLCFWSNGTYAGRHNNNGTISNNSSYLFRYTDAGGDTFTRTVSVDTTNITFTYTSVGAVSAVAYETTRQAIA